MSDVTDAIAQWIDNDPTRRGDAIEKAHEGLDYLAQYLLDEIQEAGEYPETSDNVHDGGPYGIRQEYSPTQIANADWEEIRDTLKPLPDRSRPPILGTIRDAVGDWVNPTSNGTAGLWILKVIEAYWDDRKTILWSKDPQGTADDYLPSLPDTVTSWQIWSELQLWRFDADIAYGGLPFDQEEDWDHQTMTYKQSALTPSHIERRLKENIGSLAGRVLAEIQSTIMSQLLQDDLKAWEA